MRRKRDAIAYPRNGYAERGLTKRELIAVEVAATMSRGLNYADDFGDAKRQMSFIVQCSNELADALIASWEGRK